MPRSLLDSDASAGTALAGTPGKYAPSPIRKGTCGYVLCTWQQSSVRYGLLGAAELKCGLGPRRMCPA